MTFEIEELIAAGDRVFVRWRQAGRHLGSIDGETPSGCPLVELTSAVYRVNGGRIVEYWIQMDRKGLELQLAAETRAYAHALNVGDMDKAASVNQLTVLLGCLGHNLTVMPHRADGSAPRGRRPFNP